ncbi:transcriptional regulator [Actinophytocola sp.]|uniref:transcriptional regulator n=1 Tax=Actinophytocola sp. TaxID=1872138 RepID=UPI002ED57363
MPNHGGGGDSHNEVLRVARDAVPGLRSAFADAITKVDRQIELADKELRVTSWAGDPVSTGASALYNDRTLDSDESVVDLLKFYRAQLDAAVQNLDATAEQYDRIDSDNAVGTGKNEG